MATQRIILSVSLHIVSISFQILLDRLTKEKAERQHETEVKNAANQLINDSYLNQEEQADRKDQSHHHHHDHSHGKQEETVVEHHITTDIKAAKIKQLLTEAFPMANVTQARIMHETDPLSPKSTKSCDYTTDGSMATDASHAKSAYEMVLNEGSATGLRKYTGEPSGVRRHRVHHSAPGSRGPGSAEPLAARAAWHFNTEDETAAITAHKTAKKTKLAVSPRSTHSDRPSSARAQHRSSRTDDKDQLLRAVADELKVKPRPQSGKR